MPRIHHLLTLVASCALFFYACSSSDDGVAPPPPPECDNRSVTFTIPASPEPGHVYVWAGTGFAGLGDMAKKPGETRLYWPTDVCFFPNGDPIVLDWNNHRVIAIDDNGNFEKIIGRYFGNPNDGPALEADLNHPTHVCFSPDASKLYLSAWHNSIVMEMDLTSKWIARYCGTGQRNFNADGLPRLTTHLDLPVCAQFHPITHELYISDQANQLVRRIDSDGNVHIVAGLAPISNGTSLVYQNGFSGDGGPATDARLNLERTQQADPSGKFCFDAVGNLYIADTLNHVIRIITYPDGLIDTFAGKATSGSGYAGDGGPATDALLSRPRDVVAGLDGSIYIADTGNHVIRRVAPDGTISTFVGVPRPSTASAISACELSEEQGALANEVHLASPRGVEVDGSGNLWISDTHNQVVRILFQ